MLELVDPYQLVYVGCGADVFDARDGFVQPVDCRGRCHYDPIINSDYR